MFTLPVSWLLVACVPGLLMLAAFGLGRLERDLSHGPVAAAAVDEFTESAGAMDMHTPAREGMPEALEHLHGRREQRRPQAPAAGARRAAPTYVADFSHTGEVVSPTPRHSDPRGNPQFTTPGRVKRV